MRSPYNREASSARLREMAPVRASRESILREPCLTDEWSRPDEWLAGVSWAHKHRLRQQIEQLHRLQPNWDGQDGVPPNEVAAARAVQFLEDAETIPARAVPDADGGISLYFFGTKKVGGGAHERFASILCSNDGEVVVMTRNRSTDHVEIWQVEDGDQNRRDALARIRASIA